MSVIMDFSEYENIEIFNKTQSFGEINMSDSILHELHILHWIRNTRNKGEKVITGWIRINLAANK